jgi:type IV pilus assembly protein PilO
MRFGIREIIFLSLILGLLGCSYFVMQRNSSDRQAVDADTVAKQLALNQLRQATANIEDLRGRLHELQRAIDFFQGKLPQEKEIDTILKEVWQMAEADSLQTKTIRTLKSERYAGYSEQPIQMSLSGDFKGFYAFLLQLEKLPRITRITQMSLQKLPEHEGQMQAQLTLSIFFEPEASRLAAGQ